MKKDIELFKVINEEEYSRKKLLTQIEEFVLNNKSIQNFIDSTSGVKCYDVMVGYSETNNLIIFIVSLLDEKIEAMDEKLVVMADEDLLAIDSIGMENIKDLEAIITTSYMVK